MAAEVENDSVVYQISLRTPNGEEEKFLIASNESVAILRSRILTLPKLAVYTAYHFELENAKGGQDLYLDNYTPFSEIPEIGNGVTILLVPDLYDANSIRYHIKKSVALLTNKVPQISQLVKLINEELPESLKNYTVQMELRAKQIEEKKTPQPLDLKLRVDESAAEQDVALKEMSMKDWEAEAGTNLKNFISLFKSLNEEKPVPVKSLSLSSYNPPSPSRRAMGDLIYLRIHTVENNVFHITGNVAGFYANASTDSVFNLANNSSYPVVYPTLPAIMCALSSGFKQWYTRSFLNVHSSNIATIIRSLPLLPSLESSSRGWFALEEKDSTNLFDYADMMMSDSFPMPLLKTKQDEHWMTEYNYTKSATLSAEMKASLVLIKEQSFAAAAVKAVKAIVDEGFVSILYSDKQLNYVVDDIFISYVGNKDSLFAISDCNEEVTCTRVINSLGLDELHTCLTACVDYKGRRYLAQSSIPGITNMSPTSMILWGSLDNGATIYADARVKPIVEKLAEKLHWTPSMVTPTAKTETIETPKMQIAEADASTDVHDKPEETIEFLGPVEGRIVRGGDNILYAVDYLHIAPVDAHWTEAHATRFPTAKKTIFHHRQAIVAQLLVRQQVLKSQLAIWKEAVANGETEESVDTSRIEEVEKELDQMDSTFDPNAFTPFCKPGCPTEESVRLLSVLLTQSLLPKLKAAMLEDVQSYAETSKLVTDLHNTAINARYLGELATSCAGNNASEKEAELRELCEEEMVARSVKHVLRDLMSNEVLSGASAFVTVVVLNGLLNQQRKKEILVSGKGGNKDRKVPSLVAQNLIRLGLTANAVWVRIEEDVKRHFHYTLGLWGKQSMSETQRFRLLRRVCTENGIQLEATQYNLNEDYVLHVENIVEFVPRVKFATTPVIDEACEEVYQTALVHISEGNFAVAYELAKQCFLKLISAHSQLHPQMIPLLDLMLTVLTSVNDLAGALPISRASLYCSDVIYGKDSVESAKRHTQLAALLYRCNCPCEALLHNQLALRTYESLYGQDCEEGKQIHLNLGMCYMLQRQQEKAVKAMRCAMTLKDTTGDDYLSAAFYATVLYAELKKKKEMKECRQCLEEALEGKSAEFREAMMENLEKQLKDLH